MLDFWFQPAIEYFDGLLNASDKPVLACKEP